ncbi:MAG: lytic transglycosylase domain-containing protein [Alphaproteobacteria bacterium]|nr:lytic transglycosylase domain-containing protein [Alphaproteobacteria bacterium]
MALFVLAVLLSAPARGASAVEPASPATRPPMPAPLDPAESAIEELFTILGDEDANLYRDIFRLQNDGQWKAADQRIAKLSDRILMGHVLYQRYMHPRAYRSTYVELKDWMQAYADHPDAQRIYRLAVKRRPSNYKWPRQPGWPAVNVSGAIAEPDTASEATVRRRTSRDMRYAQRRIRRWLNMGAPTKAYNYLSQKSVARHFDAIGYDEMLVRIAAGFYQVDKNEQALELAGKAAARSGEYMPDAYWWAGLTAWRMGRHALAADHFEALAWSGTNDWLASAGAYWAARAYLVSHEPGKVVPMLQLAADRPLTFYGVLGQEALALRQPIDWSVPVASVDAARGISRIPAARRGLALLQIGQDRHGMAELKRIFERLPQPMLQTLVAYADGAQIAPLAFQLGDAMHRRDGDWHGAALYPLPSWEPNGGFQLDRALIFALMRQESNFKTNAKSHAGARGLMQLMPGTAGFISGRRYRGWRSDKLYDPELNVTLGQKYMVHLLETPSIDGSLFLAVAAYNGGPGNLRRWLSRVDFRDDPLLFIESIPKRETRIYVERVLTNFWLYRDRLGQPRPSLEDVVAGDWPVYSALDPLNKQVALDMTASEEQR